MSLHIKRAYDDASKNDGFRVLVDRIWPRGVSKEDAKIDLWLKEVAPTTELRKSFDHDPDKWAEFQKKFKAEIHDNKDVWKQLKDVVKEHSTVTLVYAAKDEEHTNAVVLKKLLEK
ncbi:MAG: DUF488 domain-containing protein [Abditibacteriaceae bacterium]